MTDPRVDALKRFWDDDNGGRTDMDLLAAIDAADEAAGWVRIDLNDNYLLDRLAQAIDMPIQFLQSHGVPLDELDGTSHSQDRRRAIFAALKDPQE